MSNHSKFSKLALLSVALALAVCGCSKQSNKIQDYNAVLIASVYDNAYGECELYKDNSADYIYEVRDNKIVNKVSNNSLYETQELMKLNEDVSKSDITLKDRYTTDTYEATLDESSAHIKYLQDKGYEITRLVSTQDFIDVHLSKDNDTKRVVIYTDKVIISSIEPKEFNLEKYIKD